MNGIRRDGRGETGDGGRGSFLKERTKELSDWVNQGVLQTNIYQLKLKLILSLPIWRNQTFAH